MLLYNTACCESLAGRTADAIEHLRLAIERAERFRSLAADDSDFDPNATTPHSRSSWASGTGVTFRNGLAPTGWSHRSPRHRRCIGTATTLSTGGQRPPK